MTGSSPILTAADRSVETIAQVVGWGKTMGCIASNISVGLVEPGHVHRGGVKGGAAH
jgi:2-dehydropantoate 2-reductase